MARISTIEQIFIPKKFFQSLFYNDTAVSINLEVESAVLECVNWESLCLYKNLQGFTEPTGWTIAISIRKPLNA